MAKFILICVLCVIFFFGMVVLAMLFFCKMPPDLELVSFFKQRELAFVRLKDILSSERPEVIGLDRESVIFNNLWKRASYSDAGISKERFNLYQQLMADNDVREVFRYNNEVVILAGFSGWGFASKGPRLAYVYRVDAPPHQVETLDGIKKSNSSNTVYRPIGNNWFIRLVF